jgi:hypothetical protein
LIETSSEIKNNFESKCSYKIESNSKGYNTTIHIYEGANQEDIKKTIENTVFGFKYGQEQIIKELVKSGSNRYGITK